MRRDLHEFLHDPVASDVHPGIGMSDPADTMNCIEGRDVLPYIHDRGHDAALVQESEVMLCLYSARFAVRLSLSFGHSSHLGPGSIHARNRSNHFFMAPNLGNDTLHRS